ncbi:MAG: methyltransferase [Candidatus Omnitrophica bacterium]|nr:methyltransferase [Candidatus Omnitrophota bacterium]
MDCKKQVWAALNHKQPERIPIDFGSTNVTSMHVTCVAALRDYYGLEKKPVKVHEPHQLLGWIDEDLKEVLGIDVDGPFPPSTGFGFPNEHWKEWKMPGRDLVVLAPEKFNIEPDENGDIYMYPQGDKTAPPSGIMPSGGFYFDALMRQDPIDEEALDPEDNLEEYGILSDAEADVLADGIREAAAQGRAVVGKINGTAFGDIARVPAVQLKHPKGIRDVAEWYMSVATRPDYIHAVFSKQCEYALENLRKLNEKCGEFIDVFYICGTDFGTQTSTFCSAATYRDLYMPYYKRMNDWIHANTSWKTFKHSCGAVASFMNDFIESGFDIINPVQCSAKGMDPKSLKEAYGDRLVFWGGGVDTQKTLPFGTPEQVRGEVLQRCEIFSPGGGFVFNAVHNVQANTPVENIAAMFDAVKEFNGMK